eukprot:Selendium_serpulae@DN2126_c0_g1_i4.p1
MPRRAFMQPIITPVVLWACFALSTGKIGCWMLQNGTSYLKVASSSPSAMCSSPGLMGDEPFEDGGCSIAHNSLPRNCAQHHRHDAQIVTTAAAGASDCHQRTAAAATNINSSAASKRRSNNDFIESDAECVSVDCSSPILDASPEKPRSNMYHHNHHNHHHHLVPTTALLNSAQLLLGPILTHNNQSAQSHFKRIPSCAPMSPPSMAPDRLPHQKQEQQQIEEQPVVQSPAVSRPPQSLSRRHLLLNLQFNPQSHDARQQDHQKKKKKKKKKYSALI